MTYRIPTGKHPLLQRRATAKSISKALVRSFPGMTLHCSAKKRHYALVQAGVPVLLATTTEIRQALILQLRLAGKGAELV